VYTQCPHCQTLFRISAEQLQAAAGKAHCCRCDRIFSALANLREPEADEEWSERDLADADTDIRQQNLELPFDAPPAEADQFEQPSDLSELMQALKIAPDQPDQAAPDDQLATDDERDPFEPPFVVDDPELDSVQIGLDSQLTDSDQTGPDAPAEAEQPVLSDIKPLDDYCVSAGIPIRPQERPAGPPTPFDIPSDLPEIPPAESAPLSLDETLTDPARSGTSTFGWSLAIVLLLLLAMGQLAWFGRDHLLRYPAGRELLETTCNLLPCQLPPRREPEKIQVISRAMTSHPSRDNALLVTLTLRNNGDFPQVWPQLELSLLDRAGGLVARRSFGPAEYQHRRTELLQPGTPHSLRLELVDPGDQVAGFQFDFR